MLVWAFFCPRLLYCQQSLIFLWKWLSLATIPPHDYSGDAPMTELNPKHKRFVEEYLVDLNATAAYKRAGYVTEGNAAEASASRLLSTAKVAHAIQAAMKERSKRVEVTQDYVLKTIVDTIERCKQAEPVLDREGKETGEYKFDSGAVLKGAELLGKHLKLFTDKTEVSGSVTVEITRFGATRDKSA